MRWLKVMLYALFLGGGVRIYEYYAWFSMHSYAVKASDPVLERKFWEVFPSESLRFWPYFINQSKNIKVFLEKKMPLNISTSFSGLGNFVTYLNWLTPWIKVEWHGRFWCISKEGRMWAADDPDMIIQVLTLN